MEGKFIKLDIKKYWYLLLKAEVRAQGYFRRGNEGGGKEGVG